VLLISSRLGCVGIVVVAVRDGAMVAEVEDLATPIKAEGKADECVGRGKDG
jgi:hypothetical protein